MCYVFNSLYCLMHCERTLVSPVWLCKLNFLVIVKWENRPLKWLRYRNFQCYLVKISKTNQWLFIFCKHSPVSRPVCSPFPFSYLKYSQKISKYLNPELAKLQIKALHLESKILYTRFILSSSKVLNLSDAGDWTRTSYISSTCPTTELHTLPSFIVLTRLVPSHQLSPRFNVT